MKKTYSKHDPEVAFRLELSLLTIDAFLTFGFIWSIFSLWRFFKGRESFRTNGLILISKVLIGLMNLLTRILYVYAIRRMNYNIPGITLNFTPYAHFTKIYLAYIVVHNINAVMFFLMYWHLSSVQNAR